jgi:CheY-like chemotaxis protein
VSVQVLVVDDIRKFGQEVARLIILKAGLSTVFTASPDEACALVEREPVAVVVLDEKMPKLSGTELFVRLRSTRPNLRAIMLTAEANGDEVGQAMSLGYQDYVSKSRIADLPEHVAMQYLEFVVEQAEAEAGQGELIWPRNVLARWLRGVEVRRVSTMNLGVQEVTEADWRTVVELNAGEERKFTYGLSETTTVEIEQESQIALKNALKVKTTTLFGILETAAESTSTVKRRHATTSATGSTRTTERMLSLPNQVDPGSPKFVRVRHFQEAVVRHKTLVTLAISCRRCGIRSTIPTVVLTTAGQVATRHRDYLSDGSQRTVETGIVDLQSRGNI